MKVVDHLAIVTLEMARAALWYERREPGLGERFLNAVREAEAFIGKNPSLGQPFRRGTRKWRVPGFPYSVIYKESPRGSWFSLWRTRSDGPDIGWRDWDRRLGDCRFQPLI